MNGRSSSSGLPPAIRAIEPVICSCGVPSAIALTSSKRASCSLDSFTSNALRAPLSCSGVRGPRIGIKLVVERAAL